MKLIEAILSGKPFRWPGLGEDCDGDEDGPATWILYSPDPLRNEHYFDWWHEKNGCIGGFGSLHDIVRLNPNEDADYFIVHRTNSLDFITNDDEPITKE